MCSSTQPSVENATVTTDSAVIDRYTLANANETHNVSTISKPADWIRFAVQKSEKNIVATSLGLLKVSQITQLRRCTCRPHRSGCSATRKPERERKHLASDPLLAQGCGRNIGLKRGRRDCVAVAALRFFSLASCWRWRSVRASVHQRGTPFSPESTSPHLPHQPAEPLGSSGRTLQADGCARVWAFSHTAAPWLPRSSA